MFENSDLYFIKTDRGMCLQVWVKDDKRKKINVKTYNK